METTSQSLMQALKRHGANFFVSVPCKLLAELIVLLKRDSDITYLPVAREEEGVGVCTGAYLSGRRPVMVMQNTGIGNSVAALCSLALYYQIPLLMIISHRGMPGERIGAQVPMGNAVKPILDLIGVPTFTFSHSSDTQTVGQLVEYAQIAQRPVAAFLDFHFWQGR